MCPWVGGVCLLGWEGCVCWGGRAVSVRMRGVCWGGRGVSVGVGGLCLLG